jgi:predicted DCC family thiol-disulfide oxidoreductase YuxK
MKLQFVSRIKAAAPFPMHNHSVILFDGVCNFCNGTVNFLIRQDKKGRFKFAPLQSAVAQQLLPHEHFKKLGSVVFLEENHLSQKSTAVLKVLNRLPWYWKWTQVFWIVPRLVRDAVYDVIAANRYKWFGEKDTCMIPTPEVKSRFLE